MAAHWARRLTCSTSTTRSGTSSPPTAAPGARHTRLRHATARLPRAAAPAAARSPAASRPRPRPPLVSGADRRGDRRERAQRRAHHHLRLRPEARCAARHPQPHLIGRRLAAAARLRSVEEGWLASSPNRVPRVSRPHAQVTLRVACDRYGPGRIGTTNNLAPSAKKPWQFLGPGWGGGGHHHRMLHAGLLGYVARPSPPRGTAAASRALTRAVLARWCSRARWRGRVSDAC